MDHASSDPEAVITESTFSVEVPHEILHDQGTQMSEVMKEEPAIIDEATDVNAISSDMQWAGREVQRDYEANAKETV